jgi:hypothetical protein
MSMYLYYNEIRNKLGVKNNSVKGALIRMEPKISLNDEI